MHVVKIRPPVVFCSLEIIECCSVTSVCTYCISLMILVFIPASDKELDDKEHRFFKLARIWANFSVISYIVVGVCKFFLTGACTFVWYLIFQFVNIVKRLVRVESNKYKTKFLKIRLQIFHRPVIIGRLLRWQKKIIVRTWRQRISGSNPLLCCSPWFNNKSFGKRAYCY